MSEELNQPTAEQATAPEATTNDLSINDLQAMKVIIDIASSRGAFKPNEYISREDALIIIARALRIAKDESITSSDYNSYNAEYALSRFPDQGKIDAWAREAFAECADAGILRGDAKGNANPKFRVTRQEVASMIWTMLSSTGLN